MKTYSTYQEAKIENPECEIVTTAKGWDGRKETAGKFEPLVCGTVLGAHWIDDECGWIKCNPADYCMTVEKFLSDGNKFVDGDIIFSAVFNRVDEICNRFDVSYYNSIDGNDRNSYILRAAELVTKKPRTRVEYVKCDFPQAWEAVKEFERGQVFYRDANSMIPTDEVNYVAIELVVDVLVFHNAGNLYRKVETEIDERQGFIDAAYEHFQKIGSTIEKLGKMFDSGKFKYIGGDDADR